MIWGGVSWRGKTKLRKIDGIMDAKMYHGILVQAVQQGKRIHNNETFYFQVINTLPSCYRNTVSFLYSDFN